MGGKTSRAALVSTAPTEEVFYSPHLPALAGNALDPVLLLARRDLGSEMHVHGPVHIDLQTLRLAADASHYRSSCFGALGFWVSFARTLTLPRLFGGCVAYGRRSFPARQCLPAQRLEMPAVACNDAVRDTAAVIVISQTLFSPRWA
jgi:hypothetical protein